MRFVTFGAAGAATSLLRDPSVWSLVVQACRDGTTDIPEPDPRAVHAGLVRRSGNRLCAGPAIELAPDLDPRALDSAVDTSARCVSRHIPQLQRLTPFTHTSSPPWPTVGLLIIGGILLDLAVGEELCRAGLVTTPVTPRVWALPDAPSVTLGMRCVYDTARQAGVAGMWVRPGHPAPPLAKPADVDDIADRPQHRADEALALLRLRNAGWLEGAESRFLRLDRGSELERLTAEIAKEIVGTAYVSAFEQVSLPPSNHARLIVSRLIFERVVNRLIGSGAVSTGHPELVQRVAWVGPVWRLALATAAEESDG